MLVANCHSGAFSGDFSGHFFNAIESAPGSSGSPCATISKSRKATFNLSQYLDGDFQVVVVQVRYVHLGAFCLR